MTETTTPHTPRHDGWTPARQRIFLESLATSGLVRRAAAAAGMSHEAAYQLRHRRDGAGFRLGWDAALLLAREPVADRLMERALEGQEDVIVRDEDGRTRTRTRHDNRLALALLARLDRFANDGHVAHADARAVAGTWEAFLDLVETGADVAAFDSILHAGRPHSDEVPEPCQLPEAADPDDWLRDSYIVWWSDRYSAYRTNFPPPPGFDGDQHGDPDKGFMLSSDYERSLSPLEAERHIAYETAEADDIRAVSHEIRRTWFGIEEAEEAEETCTPCSPVATEVS